MLSLQRKSKKDFMKALRQILKSKNKKKTIKKLNKFKNQIF